MGDEGTGEEACERGVTPEERGGEKGASERASDKLFPSHCYFPPCRIAPSAFQYVSCRRLGFDFRLDSLSLTTSVNRTPVQKE
eukprot:3510409-Rhodomonas_salina.1